MDIVTVLQAFVAVLGPNCLATHSRGPVTKSSRLISHEGMISHNLPSHRIVFSLFNRIWRRKDSSQTLLDNSKVQRASHTPIQSMCTMRHMMMPRFQSVSLVPTSWGLLIYTRIYDTRTASLFCPGADKADPSHAPETHTQINALQCRVKMCGLCSMCQRSIRWR